VDDDDKPKQQGVFTAPPMEKASGFQRFLCGLAVRIALGGIGAAGTKPKQLFLDEGFTSCDQTNLAKVPDMLKTLLQLYDGIVLVTHLEELKDGGDAIIPIKRDEVSGISTLQW
jgi:exonuclease SbcC